MQSSLRSETAIICSFGKFGLGCSGRWTDSGHDTKKKNSGRFLAAHFSLSSPPSIGIAADSLPAHLSN